MPLLIGLVRRHWVCYRPLAGFDRGPNTGCRKDKVRNNRTVRSAAARYGAVQDTAGYPEPGPDLQKI
jgi:hypothetical protein